MPAKWHESIHLASTSDLQAAIHHAKQPSRTTPNLLSLKNVVCHSQLQLIGQQCHQLTAIDQLHGNTLGKINRIWGKMS